MHRISTVLIAFILIITSTYAIGECQEIKGENISLTLDNNIDGNGQTCFYIEGINITLDCRNYIVYNSSTAILINNSHAINVLRCKIENSTNGIFVQVQTPVGYSEQYDMIIMRNTSAFLANITITDTTNAIIFNRSHQNNVRFANIKGANTSVSLLHSYGNIIENSSILNGQTGFLIDDTFANGSQANATPIFEKAKNGKEIKSIEPENDTTVVRGKYGSIIRHNIIQNNSVGIKLNQTANNSIYNNIFNNSGNVLSDSNLYNYINYWNSSYECQKSIINGRCSGGNYWNDYYGYDNGDGAPPHDVYFDGIGDTLLPYMPNGEVSGDELPLTHALPPDWVANCRNITEPGVYTQKRDIFGVMSSTNRKCIEVLAENVTLNCDGFNITDNTTYTNSYGIYIYNYSNLTVVNCTVINYTYGIYQKDSNYGMWDGNRFSNDLYNVYFDFTFGPYMFSFYEKNITSNNYVYDKKMYYYVNGKTGDGILLSAGIPADVGFLAIVHYDNYDITGLNLKNNTPLILLVNVSNIAVHDNVFNFSNHAVRLHNSTNISVTQNQISASPTGLLYSLYSNQVNSSKNILLSSAGNYFWYTDNYEIAYNIGNMSSYLIQAFGSQNGKIYDNYVNGTSELIGGIEINPFGWCQRRGDNVTIYNNNIHKFCEYPGKGIITIACSDNSYISSNNGSWGNCYPYTNSGFVSVSSSSNVTIINHTIYGFVTPISLFHVSNSTIYNNSVIRTHGSGGGMAIILSHGAGNIVYENYIEDARVGIRGWVSTNKIFSNTIINSESGIELGFSTGNYVYNNYVYNCTTSYGFDDYWPPANRWSLLSINCSLGPNIIGGPCWGGNYWGNYTGCDDDGNGIGETSYPISGRAGVSDLFPLTNTACKKQPKEPKIQPVEPRPSPIPVNISPAGKTEKKQNTTIISINSTQIYLPSAIYIN